MKRFILFIQLLVAGFLLSDPAFSQRLFEASMGLGGPEFFNIKIRYGESLQAGVCVGGYIGHGLSNSNKTIAQGSFAAEVIYHLPGRSRFSDWSPWYILAGLGYYHLPISEWYGSYDIGVYPRAGRTFYISEVAGVNIDAGIFLPLSMAAGYDTFKFTPKPSGNISIFLRF